MSRHPYVFKLYWSYDSMLISTELSANSLKQKLDTYQEQHPDDYNVQDFIEELCEDGYYAEILTPDAEIYF